MVMAMMKVDSKAVAVIYGVLSLYYGHIFQLSLASM